MATKQLQAGAGDEELLVDPGNDDKFRPVPATRRLIEHERDRLNKGNVLFHGQRGAVPSLPCGIDLWQVLTSRRDWILGSLSP